MLIQIIAHTPLWVWGLLAALVALGVHQSRGRLVAPAQLLALPLALLALGLSSLLASFLAQPALGLAWLLTLAAGAALGLRLPVPAGTRWDTARQRLFLAGSWLPLGFILAIFLLRYSAGVSFALHPSWRVDTGVLLLQSGVFGLLSGLFLGRALRLRGLVARAAGRRAENGAR